MFSSIFGKRRSPIEDDTPPIPGPKPEDGFIIINPSPPQGNLYPSVSGGTVYPPRPAPPVPAPPVPAPPVPVLPRANIDQTFHYLQGVPFIMSKELQMASNKDAITRDFDTLLSFLASKINMSNFQYDFSVEKSVLKEC